MYSIILFNLENLDYEDLELAMAHYRTIDSARWLIRNGDRVEVLESRGNNVE
ncbi:MAG: hypothetical protein RJA83_352 [Pseudomonadota bacterium]|jgi:hypothetical protein